MSAYTEEYVEDNRSEDHGAVVNEDRPRRDANNDKRDENRTMTTIHVSNLDAKAKLYLNCATREINICVIF